MPTARAGHIAAVLNNKIYVIGGGNISSGALNTVLEYNPSANVWITKTSMPTPRGGFSDSSDAVVNGVIYVIGGEDSSGYTTKVEAYSP
jgi:N-acetylneuraminic acid mutarotase